MSEAVMRAQISGLVGTILTASVAAAAQQMAPRDIQATFFNGEAFTASTQSGRQFKMVFTSDGKMTREPPAKSGYKSAGTWKLDQKGQIDAPDSHHQ